MKNRRLNVALKKHPALQVSRVVLGRDRLVYVLVADRKLKYDDGSSRIAYIGTTKKGLSRVSQSVAARADAILRLHGVESFEARIVACKPRQKVKTWFKLERALLLAFRERYGTIPKCNSKGSKMKEIDEFTYFSKKRIDDVIDDLS